MPISLYLFLLFLVLLLLTSPSLFLFLLLLLFFSLVLILFLPLHYIYPFYNSFLIPPVLILHLLLPLLFFLLTGAHSILSIFLSLPFLHIPLVSSFPHYLRYICLWFISSFPSSSYPPPVHFLFFPLLLLLVISCCCSKQPSHSPAISSSFSFFSSPFYNVLLILLIYLQLFILSEKTPSIRPTSTFMFLYNSRLISHNVLEAGLMTKRITNRLYCIRGNLINVVSK